MSEKKVMLIHVPPAHDLASWTGFNVTFEFNAGYGWRGSAYTCWEAMFRWLERELTDEWQIHVTTEKLTLRRMRV